MNLTKALQGLLLFSLLLTACGASTSTPAPQAPPITVSLTPSPSAAPILTVNGMGAPMCEKAPYATVVLVSKDGKNYIRCEPIEHYILLAIDWSEKTEFPAGDWQNFSAGIYIPFEYKSQVYNFSGKCNNICSEMTFYGPDLQVLGQFHGEPDKEFIWTVDLTQATPGKGSIVVKYENWGGDARLSLFAH